MSGFCKCKSYSHFFSKNISIYAIFDDQIFNDTLTNIVSFEQLGPVLFFWWKNLIWSYENYRVPLDSEVSPYFKELSNERKKKYKELKKRIEREKELNIIAQKMERKKQLTVSTVSNVKESPSIHE